MRALVSLVASLAAFVAPAFAHEAEAPVRAPSFTLPEPGSYELPAILHVPGFTLLDERGAAAPLPGLTPGSVAVVSFIYTHCSDGAGCPAALAVLQRLDRLVAADPALAGRVRLFTVSFDPAHDTPERMASLREGLAPRSDWRFLTAASPAAIAPVLAAYGQDVLPLVGSDERALGLFRHVLKVFLVDPTGAVRNVYSTGFLSPELLLVDVRTILPDALESRRAGSVR